MRRLILVLGLIAALVIPAAAPASVRLASVTSPVRRGANAALAVVVSPPRTCTIAVFYKSGPSQTAGLYPKRAVSGWIGWTWKVGSRTTPGRWPIVVSCGSAGSLRTSFVVK